MILRFRLLASAGLMEPSIKQPAFLRRNQVENTGRQFQKRTLTKILSSNTKKSITSPNPAWIAITNCCKNFDHTIHHVAPAMGCSVSLVLKVKTEALWSTYPSVSTIQKMSSPFVASQHSTAALSFRLALEHGMLPNSYSVHLSELLCSIESFAVYLHRLSHILTSTFRKQ